MKLPKLVIFLSIVLLSTVNVSTQIELTGTYERKEDNNYEIIIYFPIPHSSFLIEEIGLSLETISTNRINITLTENDFNSIKSQLTIISDNNQKYVVELSEKAKNSFKISGESIIFSFLSFFVLALCSLLFVIPKEKFKID